MKFKLLNGGEIEISGIKNVVTNLTRNGVRQVPTTIWRRHKSGRWLKSDMNTPGKIDGGFSDREMRVFIDISTAIPITRVWSHGDTLNITTEFSRETIASLRRLLF
jgi:hypothetical protein